MLEVVSQQSCRDLQGGQAREATRVHGHVNTNCIINTENSIQATLNTNHRSELSCCVEAYTFKSLIKTAVAGLLHCRLIYQAYFFRNLDGQNLSGQNSFVTRFRFTGASNT